MATKLRKMTPPLEASGVGTATKGKPVATTLAPFPVAIGTKDAGQTAAATMAAGPRKLPAEVAGIAAVVDLGQVDQRPIRQVKEGAEQATGITTAEAALPEMATPHQEVTAVLIIGPATERLIAPRP